MTNTSAPANKLQSSQAHKYALWILPSYTEPPVRNPYQSEETSGMYIQLGRKVRAHSRGVAMRDGIKLPSGVKEELVRHVRRNRGTV